jgi:hypothetical protein
VHQRVKNLQGEVLWGGEVLHVLTVNSGLIAAMCLGVGRRRRPCASRCPLGPRRRTQSRAKLSSWCRLLQQLLQGFKSRVKLAVQVDHTSVPDAVLNIVNARGILEAPSSSQPFIFESRSTSRGATGRRGRTQSVCSLAGRPIG